MTIIDDFSMLRKLLSDDIKLSSDNITHVLNNILSSEETLFNKFLNLNITDDKSFLLWQQLLVYTINNQYNDLESILYEVKIPNNCRCIMLSIDCFKGYGRHSQIITE